MSKIVECSLVITKASLDPKSGEMRFSASASDTQRDSYNESMSLQLFKDFVSRAENGEKPPEEYCSEYWKGGLPYLSVAHYPDLDGVAVPGKVTSLYIDGNILKAKGVFFNTPLGNACFKSIRDGLIDKSLENKVRISIGFLDYAHRHGNVLFERRSSNECQLCMRGVGDKVYVSGHLIHLALTRVPVNTRTGIEPEVVMKSEGIKTRKDDAASIIGEDLAEDINKKSELVGKSELVMKSEEDVVGGEETATEVPNQESDSPEVAMVEASSQGESFEEKVLSALGEIQKAMGEKKKKMDDEEMEEEGCDPKKKKKMKSAISDALQTFSDAFEDVYSQSLPIDKKLQVLQDPLNVLGMSIRSAIETSVQEDVKPSVVEKENPDLSALIASSVANGVAAAIGPLVEQMKSLTQHSVVPQAVPNTPASVEWPQPRNITPSLIQNSAPTKKLSQIEQLSQRSVGLL